MRTVIVVIIVSVTFLLGNICVICYISFINREFHRKVNYSKLITVNSTVKLITNNCKDSNGYYCIQHSMNWKCSWNIPIETNNVCLCK